MNQILAIAQDIVTQGAVQHGLNARYPLENGEQRFSASSGVLEIRIADYGGWFSWGQLLNVLEGLEVYLVAGQRWYKTWFEFGVKSKRKGLRPLGRGKLYNLQVSIDND